MNFLFYALVAVLSLILGIALMFILYLLFSFVTNMIHRARIPVSMEPEDEKDTKRTLAYPGKIEEKDKEVNEDDGNRNKDRTFEKLRRFASGDSEIETIKRAAAGPIIIPKRGIVQERPDSLYSGAELPPIKDERESRSSSESSEYNEPATI